MLALQIQNMNIRVEKFSWHSESKTFAIDASEVGPVGIEMFHQLPHAGQGIGIINGDKVVEYELLETVPGEPGTIVAWTLVPTTVTVRKHPKTAATKVTIFND